MSCANTSLRQLRISRRDQVREDKDSWFRKHQTQKDGWSINMVMLWPRSTSNIQKGDQNSILKISHKNSSMNMSQMRSLMEKLLTKRIWRSTSTRSIKEWMYSTKLCRKQRQSLSRQVTKNRSWTRSGKERPMVTRCLRARVKYQFSFSRTCKKKMKLNKTSDLKSKYYY